LNVVCVSDVAIVRVFCCDHPDLPCL